MMVEGIFSVLEGEAPRVIEQKLSSYLSVEERRKLAVKNQIAIRRRASLAKRRKKKKGLGHIDESWLLPYADLMTLLLAVFIVLFASSTVDEDKVSTNFSGFQ